MVEDAAQLVMNGKPPGYFDCLEAMDALEFHVLDRMEPGSNTAMAAIGERAGELHRRLTDIAQAAIDTLIGEIRSQRMARADLLARFQGYARAGAGPMMGDRPDYDLFDDFLSDLLAVDIEPCETHPLTDEMVALQPTPGRIIMEMIRVLPLTEADRFYDLGSGLGRVPILVSLLTGVRAVGIEVEPTYVDYARGSAEKLGLAGIEFRSMDVRDADFRDGTVFFLYTPFTGSILRGVLDRLREVSRDRRITVCSYGPCTTIMQRESWLDSVKDSYSVLYRLEVFGNGTI